MQEIVRYLRVGIIQPNRRLCCSAVEVDALCGSISLQGQREPVTVFFDGEGFRLVDGEKRWRACKKLGIASLLVRIVESPL